MKNKYETHGNLTIIHCNQRKVTFIDTEDLEKLKDYKGTVSVVENRHTWYAIIQINKKRIYLHSFLMKDELQEGREVDHKNNNGLDNRRKTNLRSCTHAENMQNLNAKNVYFDKYSNKYRVAIDLQGKTISGGYFNNYNIAVRVAKEMKAELKPFSKEAAKAKAAV